MVAGGGSSGGRAEAGWDVLVSYAAADQAWAEWIAWVLGEAGHRVFLRAWDVVPAAHWVAETDAAVRLARLTVPVVSSAYYVSRHAAEWRAVFAADESGWGRRLLPARVEDCPLDGLLAPLARVDLFDLDALAAVDRLHDAVTLALAGAGDRPVWQPALPAGGRVPGAPPGFPGRAWLRGLPVVEPLSDPYPVITADAGPLALIRARGGLVPFQPRDELDALLDWCSRLPADTSAPRIRIVSGPGGSGKTHLLAELTARLASDGWYAGFLRDGLPAESLEWLSALPGPVAVAVDYAEATRTAEVLAAVRALALRKGGPTCLVLNARTVSGWWTEELLPALRRDGLPSGVLQDQLPVRHPSSARVFRRAREAFAVAAGQPTPTGAAPAAPATGTWTTLDLVMLAWLQVHDSGARPSSSAELYENVLDHEVGYWARAYSGRFGKAAPTRRALRAAGAAVTLLAPVPSRLDGVLGQSAVFATAELLRDELVETLTRVLPGDPADGRLAVRPDAVGDHLSTTVYQASPGALVAVLTAADDAERLHACLAINRAAGTAPAPEVVDRLAMDAVGQVPGLWRPALEVAAAQGGPILTALVRLAYREDSPLPLVELARDLPQGHATLRPLALAAAAQHAVAGGRARTATETTTAGRVAALNTLALRLFDAGDRSEALSAAREAVALCRLSTQTEPARSMSDLAIVLNTLAHHLSAAGEHADAAAAAQESVELHRALTGASRADFAPYLAMSLNTLAVALSGIGDRARAVSAAQEAVELGRRLTDADPVAGQPVLAGALHTLANQLAEAGERSEALVAAREAVGLRRRLADLDLPAFLPGLATSLLTLATALSECGERSEALSAAREAVALLRQLADVDPAAFLPDLAGALANLGVFLAGEGGRSEALSVAREAVDLRRRLADENPAAFLPQLASSLGNLAHHLTEAGERLEAVSTAREAVDLCRRQAAASPEIAIELVSSLNALASALSNVGRRPEALSAIREAATVSRRLADDDPAACKPYLAASLANLAVQLSGAGERHEAADAIREAAGLYRQLAAASPDAFLPGLATALNNLAAFLPDVGERWEAAMAAREAVELRRQLAKANPEAFLPDLARALRTVANRLPAVGEWTEALAAAREAVELDRRLADADPAAFLPRLAGSLNSLSNTLSAVGERVEALATAREAAGLFRRLAETESEAFLPDLARVLATLANGLHANAERVEALATAREAVSLFRRLAEAEPAAFLPELAGSLHNLAAFFLDASDSAAALTAVRDAVDVYHQLAAASPGAFLPELARSRTVLAVCVSESGDRAQALSVARDATNLYRQLAAAHPAEFTADLAGALGNLANHLSDVGEWAEALSVAREASIYYQKLSRSNPAAFLPNLANALSVLADALEALGRRADALEGFLPEEPDEDARRRMVEFLLAARASWRADRDDLDGAVDDLVAATRQTGRAQSSALTGLTNRGVRSCALALGAAHPNLTRRLCDSLPGWATRAIASDTIAAIAAWADASSWADREAVVAESGSVLLDPARRVEIDTLVSLCPDNTAAREVAETLDEITADGLTEVARRRRDDEAFQRSLAGWLASQTWAESREYVVTHPDLVDDPRTHTRLAAAGDPTSTLHLGILRLLGRREAVDVFDIVEDEATGAEEAMSAVARGDAETLADLLLAAPYLAGLPFMGSFLAAVRVLLTGDARQAADLARAGAGLGSDGRRAAVVVRLRRLRRLRADLAAPIDQLVALYQDVDE